MNCCRIRQCKILITSYLVFVNTTPLQHINLVDDDLDEQNIFCAAVRIVAPKSTVTCNSSCEELLNELINPVSVPEIIFMDINMPRVKGHECLCRLYNNEVWKGIPVIMYSNSSLTADIDLAFKNGAVNYMAKPTRFKQLQNMVEVALSRNYKTHQRIRENFVLPYN